MRSRTLSCALSAMLAALFASRVVAAQNPQSTEQTEQQQPDAPVPSAQLDSLVAPIALYPDPLLAQVLAASTYPLEIVQLQQWLAQHSGLKDQALVDAVSQQSWDPSVQSMAALPDVVKLLASDVKWVTDLGNAFLAQQSDVMDAVQRMRHKASGNGKLASSDHVKVENKTEGGENVIVIEQSDPQTIYVPSYDPTVVYGAPAVAAYAYPPLGYYAAGAAISFGVGVAMGAAFHGGWGYGCGWGGGGHNEVNINRQNNFQRNTVAGNGNKWQHNPQHRGGTPYGNRATNDRFGGGQRNARASADRGGADRGGANRGAADRGSANRGGADRGGADRGGGNRGGGDRVGNRSVSNPGSGSGRSGGNSALGSGNRGGGGYNGGAARQSSNRGSASTGNTSRASRGGSSASGGNRGGGGRSSSGGRGGGGRGGGGRGGGGRR